MTDVSPTVGQIRQRFADRLDLLHGAGQLDPNARVAAEEVVAELCDRFGLDVATEGIEMLLTHAALAFTRLVRGEDEPPVPDMLVVELRDRIEEREAVANAVRARGRVLGAEVPHAELLFLTAHVSALRDRRVS
jgi:transcriptional regulatory protein LevR